jgi:hypothetical protein
MMDEEIRRRSTRDKQLPIDEGTSLFHTLIQLLEYMMALLHTAVFKDI